MQEIKRILTVCEIESRTELVHKAAELAREINAELFVLTVIYDPFGIKGLSLPRPSLREDYRKLVEKVRSNMQEMISREAKILGIRIQKLIREEKPVSAILSAIEELAIDLLVLPAHSETRLEHVLFGGKNKELFRKMPCSILFIKSEPGPLPEEEEGEEAEEAAA